MTPTSGDAGFDIDPHMLGCEFSVSTPLTVTALGWLDATGAGLTDSHMVGIFDASTSALLISANIPNGSSAKLMNGFRTMPVSLQLPRGNYIVAGLRAANGDAALVRAKGVTTSPQITYLEEREAASTQFEFASIHEPLNEKGAFGPTFVIAGSANDSTITGIVSSASFQPSFSSGAFISIFGTGLASTSRTWVPADFANGTNLPTSLDGVSVTIGGSKAFVEYVSPGQLNVVVPDGVATNLGTPVIVSQTGKPDVSSFIGLQAFAPALFTWPTGTADTGKYAVAQHADYTNVGKVGLFPQLSANFTTPAHAGETIILYGTGFGPTSPALSSSVIADKPYPLSPFPTATMGGTPAQVSYAGLVPGLANIYQVNLVVPPNLAGGDWPVVITVNNIHSSMSLITIQ